MFLQIIYHFIFHTFYQRGIKVEIANLDMDPYCAQSEAFSRQSTPPMDNYMASDSLKNFYNNQFSSSAIMASFTNNYHNHLQHHDQQQHQHQQQQQHLRHYFSNSYDPSSYSTYPHSHSQFNPYVYQPLTPPPHQNDYNVKNNVCINNSKKSELLVKSENIQQKLLGK